MLTFLLGIIWAGAAGSALWWGLDYYRLPLQERAYSDLAPLFAPTGLVGQGLGVVGTVLIVLGVVGYVLRKRVAWLAGIGAIRHWLQVHIFLCTLGPFFVLLHTTFKFGGLVSIAFWSMAIVVVSGLFGRYVYAHIPKTVHGRFLEAEAVETRAAELAREIGARAGLPVTALEVVGDGPRRGAPQTLAGALAQALRDDLRGRARRRRVRRLLRERDVPRPLERPLLALVKERDRLRRQGLLLRPFQRLFHYWHVVHLPLAMVMFLVLGVHVAVAVLFGYTWIFGS